jgi:hypothetical protein
VVGSCAGCGVRVHGGGEGAVKLACDVSLEAAPNFAIGFPFSAAAGQVFLGAGVCAHAGVDDGVDGLVEGSVCAAVESVAGGLAAGSFDRAGLGECGEGGIVAAAPGWENETMAWAALMGSIPGWVVSSGARSLTMAASSVRLALRALSTW